MPPVTEDSLTFHAAPANWLPEGSLTDRDPLAQAQLHSTRMRPFRAATVRVCERIRGHCGVVLETRSAATRGSSVPGFFHRPVSKRCFWDFCHGLRYLG